MVPPPTDVGYEVEGKPGEEEPVVGDGEGNLQAGVKETANTRVLPCYNTSEVVGSAKVAHDSAFMSRLLRSRFGIWKTSLLNSLGSILLVLGLETLV